MRFQIRLPFFLVGLFCLGCSSQLPVDGLGDTQYDRSGKLGAGSTNLGVAQPNKRRETSNRKLTSSRFSSKGGGVLEIQSNGFFRYGPEIAESRACANAKTDMQLNAIRNAVGVVLNRDSSMACGTKLYETRGADCLLLDVMWTAAAEATLIRDVQVHEQNSYKTEGGRECKVSGTVRLERLGSSKDTFIVDLKILPSNQLRDGQELSFFVSSAKPAFHYIYSYQDDLEEAQLIFPNEHDQDNQFVGERSIPSEGSKDKWYIDASLPEGQPYALEHLLMISAQRDLGALPRSLRIGQLREVIAVTDAGYLSLTRSFYEIQ